jgi:site-specific DNA-methyltransferase (adenine-specific)
LAQSFFQAIGIKDDRASIKKLSSISGVPVETLNHFHKAHVLPDQYTFKKLSGALPIDYHRVALKMGVVTRKMQMWLAENADRLTVPDAPCTSIVELPEPPALQTEFGKLYQSDCMDILPALQSETVDLVFADPPFNLAKAYNDLAPDDMAINDYRLWCYAWLDECIRILKPGGSLFVWNIPHHNQIISQYISQFLTFRHWIAVQMNYGFGIPGKLYPAHYSLLYFTKGKKPSVFQPDRLPLDVCPKCSNDLKDYGGYKQKLNPNGINLKDVWLDIYPVRHKKNRKHNELPISLLDRVIELASAPGDTILDPFVGSGTAPVTAELKKRHWVGCEIGEIDTIINRFNSLKTEQKLLSNQRSQLNTLFTPKIRKRRTQNNIWVNK